MRIYTISNKNGLDLEQCRLVFENYRKVDLSNQVTVQTEKSELIALKPSKRI